MNITKLLLNYGLPIGAVALIIVALLLTPVAMKTGNLLGIMDKPNARKVHTTPIARAGGLMVITVVGMSIALMPTLLNLSVSPKLETWALLILFMFALGFADDAFDLDSKRKFLIQFIIALMFVGLIGYPESLKISYIGTFELWGWLTALICVIWLVGVTNAVNLIDGLDGMASSVSLFAATAMLVFAYRLNDPESVVILVGLIAALIGFLFFNLKPAKVFLGDGGSLTIGFILGTVSLRLMTLDGNLSIVSFILLLFIPIFDTLWSILRRKMNHKKIFEADRNHLHHKLLDRFGYWKTIIIINVLCVSLMFFVVGVNLKELELLSLILGIIGLILFSVTSIISGYFKVNGGK